MFFALRISGVFLVTWASQSQPAAANFRHNFSLGIPKVIPLLVTYEIWMQACCLTIVSFLPTSQDFKPRFESGFKSQFVERELLLWFSHIPVFVQELVFNLDSFIVLHLSVCVERNQFYACSGLVSAWCGIWKHLLRFVSQLFACNTNMCLVFSTLSW